MLWPPDLSYAWNFRTAADRCGFSDLCWTFRKHFIFVWKPSRTKCTKIKCIQNTVDLYSMYVSALTFVGMFCCIAADCLEGTSAEGWACAVEVEGLGKQDLSRTKSCWPSAIGGANWCRWCCLHRDTSKRFAEWTSHAATKEVLPRANGQREGKNKVYRLPYIAEKAWQNAIRLDTACRRESWFHVGIDTRKNCKES